MIVAVTAATGQLGRIVVKELLESPAVSTVVAVVRDPDKAADLAAAGAEVRVADYADPAALRAALEGVDRVLLISGTEFGQRVAQHANVVEAAREAGVSLLAYTSVVRATEATVNPVAREHAATERVIEESGVPFTILRNPWYSEGYAGVASGAAASGVHVTSAGDALTASATRADLAAAAVAVLTGDGHAGKRYELGATPAWTQQQLAEAMSAATGKPIEVKQVSPEQHLTALTAAGVPEMWAKFSVASDAAAVAGETGAAPGDLEALIGRAATPLADGIATGLAAGR